MTDLWFSKLDTHSLCREGGNGPHHPTHIYAINDYVESGMTFLDVGCGSGATLEALLTRSRNLMLEDSDGNLELSIDYKGVDFVEKHIKWCKKRFPLCNFAVENALDLDEKDNSFDVVFSRHLLEHLPSFEDGLTEHLRVSKDLVIIVLWAELTDSTEDRIINIEEDGVTYPTEYSNRYSRDKMKKTLESLNGWKLLEFNEIKTNGPIGHDTVIVLRRTK